MFVVSDNDFCFASDGCGHHVSVILVWKRDRGFVWFPANNFGVREALLHLFVESCQIRIGVGIGNTSVGVEVSDRPVEFAQYFATPERSEYTFLGDLQEHIAQSARNQNACVEHNREHSVIMPLVRTSFSRAAGGVKYLFRLKVVIATYFGVRHHLSQGFVSYRSLTLLVSQNIRQ